MIFDKKEEYPQVRITKDERFIDGERFRGNYIVEVRKSETSMRESMDLSREMFIRLKEVLAAYEIK